MKYFCIICDYSSVVKFICNISTIPFFSIKSQNREHTLLLSIEPGPLVRTTNFKPKIFNRCTALHKSRFQKGLHKKN